MAKPIELGLVFEGEDAERFFEYDENPEVSDELIAMFIEGKEIYEQDILYFCCFLHLSCLRVYCNGLDNPENRLRVKSLPYSKSIKNKVLSSL
ncbi:hypothetical protein [Methanosarcina sp. UBA411]|jgi:hypothetical protein|uniref:hypothetical protein n=1 Tax=Methanosarcina sp. UBA411 TaxID=1915589 RepID=UPI0025E625BD|nr:hypothetical protein [Methanosarcina sp. UBA411]